MSQTYATVSEIAQLSHRLKIDGFNDEIREKLIRLGLSDAVLRLAQHSSVALQNVLDEKVRFDRWDQG